MSSSAAESSIARTPSAHTDPTDVAERLIAPPRPKPRREVPFHRATLGAEEEREIIDTLRSGWLTTGPKTKRFEQRFAEYVGAKHAVAVNSCTAALHLSLVAHEIGPGDEVITTPITFAATANVVEHVGARPVFVDVEPDTLNMDPDRIEAAITPRTRAIIPVHFSGHPCDMDRIHAIARRHDLIVIEDAAHAIESAYQGRKIGSLAGTATTCFSFYATKNMTTGEGGMVTTDDDALAQRIRMLSLHGISVDAWNRAGTGGYRHWDLVAPGYKYNMFDLQASLGLHQLARIETFHQLRCRWTDAYDEAFADLPEITPLKRRRDVKAARHVYVARFDAPRLTATRDEILKLLQDRGIGVGVHFRAVHRHPYYRERYGYQPGLLPVAERAGDQCVSLPMFPGLTAEDVTYVIEQVRDVVSRIRR